MVGSEGLEVLAVRGVFYSCRSWLGWLVGTRSAGHAEGVGTCWYVLREHAEFQFCSFLVLERVRRAKVMGGGRWRSHCEERVGD